MTDPIIEKDNQNNPPDLKTESLPSSAVIQEAIPELGSTYFNEQPEELWAAKSTDEKWPNTEEEQIKGFLL